MRPIEVVAVGAALEAAVDVAVAAAVKVAARCWLMPVCYLAAVQAYPSCFHRCAGC